MIEKSRTYEVLAIWCFLCGAHRATDLVKRNAAPFNLFIKYTCFA